MTKLSRKNRTVPKKHKGLERIFLFHNQKYQISQRVWENDVILKKKSHSSENITQILYLCANKFVKLEFFDGNILCMKTVAIRNNYHFLGLKILRSPRILQEIDKDIFLK